MEILWSLKCGKQQLLKGVFCITFVLNVLLFFQRDFDAAETVGEKVSKIFNVKGVKGLRKLMKEIAVTASTGKHDNELVGRCNISLRVCL